MKSPGEARSPVLRLAVSLGLAFLAPGCGSSRTFVARPGIYDRIPEEDLERARDARKYLELQNLRRAHEILGELQEKLPDNVPIALLLQEVKLSLLLRGQAAEGPPSPTSPLTPAKAQAVLYDFQKSLVEEAPSVVGLILAARVAADPETALVHLDLVAGEDPECIWIHYGRAHFLYLTRRFPEVRAEIAAALELDPGHLPTLRLEATLLAQAGDVSEAIEVLEYWLEQSAEDPFVDPRMYAEAQVDLAALYVFDDEPQDALAYLSAVNRRFLRDDLSRARATLVRAAALEATGNHAAALGAAQEAQRLDPGELLALVDQAYLLKRIFGQDREEQAWEELVATAEAERERREQAGEPASQDDLDFQGMLYELQARTRLERIRRDHESRPPEGEP